MKSKPLSKRKLERLWKDEFTPGQRILIKKHGTPAEFARACYACVPGAISMDEARAAVKKYSREFEKA